LKEATLALWGTFLGEAIRILTLIVARQHPLRLVPSVVNDIMTALDGDFAKAYAVDDRPSIPPQRLLRGDAAFPLAARLRKPRRHGYQRNLDRRTETTGCWLRAPGSHRAVAAYETA
jgi:hypothetical protein